MNTLVDPVSALLDEIAVLTCKGALLALVVGVAIPLLRRKLSPAWRHGLWLLVLVRFAAPDVATSPWSMSRWMKVPRAEVPAATVVDPVIAVPHTIVVRESASLEQVPLAVENTDSLTEAPVAPMPSERVISTVPEPHPVQWTLRQWLALVWLAGIVCVLSVTVLLHVQMCRRVRHDGSSPPPDLWAALHEACAVARVTRRPDLIITDAVRAPALFGFVRPAILLPRGFAAECDPALLRMTVLHELAHLRRLDLCTQVAASLVTALHWFNPLVWWTGRRMRVEAEMAADARVLGWTSAQEAHRMGGMLLAFVNQAAASWVVWLVSATLLGIAENKRDLRHRIEALTDLAHGRRTWWLMGLAAFAALAITGLTKAPAEDAQKDRAQPAAPTAATITVRTNMAVPHTKPVAECHPIVLHEPFVVGEDPYHSIPLGTEAPKPDPKTADGPAARAGLQTAKGGRILTLSVPAPRGLIVDRNGVPFAQNVVVSFPCLSFPQMDQASAADKIQFARKRLDAINATLRKSYALEDAQILEHYDKRRWLPLVLSRVPLTDVEKTKFQTLALDGISLRPAYQRIYPQHEVAGHVLGYVGKRGPWASGEIRDHEALWPTSEGIRGIEKECEDYLKGSPGTIQIILDEKGNRVEEITVANPVPGGNVVLAIDLEMQKLAERLLRERVKRGAFVITDVTTGDVLALASQPNFDPNEFVPLISRERLKELQSDPANPLLGRAFQAEYPPASTFMSITAIGMLRSGSVNESTILPCPRSFTIGDRIAHNWASEDEGEMNIMGALTRSCNTWFFQAAMLTNSAYISRAGEIFGYGRPTGIRMEEVSGIMPTNEWYREQFGHAIGKGDLTSIGIGQGAVQATPVQVARAMGALGNRKSLMDARLVLQVQDCANHIITAFDVTPHPLNVPQHDLVVVHQGLYEAVHHERGTGKAAAHPRLSISGKTGTGQWVPSKKQNISWFAGFAPFKFPVHSFAVVCEGEPGEAEAGGTNKAAPILGAFYQEYLTDERFEALEKKSRAIAAPDGLLIDSVPLGTGCIIRKKTSE